MQYKWLKCTETVSLLCNGLAGMNIGGQGVWYVAVYTHADDSCMIAESQCWHGKNGSPPTS